MNVQTGFMGILKSLMVPYFPKISRMWSSLTFLVSASTTICNQSQFLRNETGAC